MNHLKESLHYCFLHLLFYAAIFKNLWLKITPKIQRVLGEPMFGHRQAVGFTHRFQHFQHFGMSIVQRSVCSPSDDHQVGLPSKASDVPVIVDANGVIDQFQSFGVC